MPLHPAGNAWHAPGSAQASRGAVRGTCRAAERRPMQCARTAFWRNSPRRSAGARNFPDSERDPCAPARLRRISATPKRSGGRPNSAPGSATSLPGAPWLSPATAAAIPPWPSSWQGSTTPRRPVPVRHATAGAPDEQPLRKAPEGPAVLRKIRGAPPSLAGAGEFCAPPPRRTARGMRGLRPPAYLGVH